MAVGSQQVEADVGDRQRKGTEVGDLNRVHLNTLPAYPLRYLDAQDYPVLDPVAPGVVQPQHSTQHRKHSCDVADHAPPPSVLDFVANQPLQTGTVGGPMSKAISGSGTVVVKIGDGTVVVKVYALGSGVSIPGQGSDLSLAQGAFELEAHGHRLVIDPLAARVTHRLVTPVEGDISAVWQEVEAVDQEDLAKFGTVGSHGFGTSIETAILSLPQGTGKTLFAKEIAARLGCTNVVDGWSPQLPLLGGALHLTDCEVF